MIDKSIKHINKSISKNFNDKDFLELFNKGGLAFLFRIGGQIMGFLLTFVIAYFFGANGLGDYVLAIVVLKIFTLISKLGLDTASIKYIASYAAEKKDKSITLFRSRSIVLILVMSIISSLIMYFGSDYIALFITANPYHIRITSFFILPMAIFIFHYQNMRGLKQIGGYSFFFWMSQALFSLIAILILTLFTRDPNVPLYSYLISLTTVAILSIFVFTYFFRKHFKITNKYDNTSESFKSILSVSLPLMLAQAVHFIMSWTDKLMLGILDSPDVVAGLSSNSAQIGVYHTAFKLSMFATIGLMAVKSIASPKFAELYKKNDIKALQKVTQQSTKLIFWTTLPLVVIFMLCSDFLMGLFGEEFKVGVFAFIVLSFGRVVVSFSGAAGNLLQMCGRQVIFMNVAIIGSIINIILNFSLIPIYGINGSAIATMVSIVVFNLLLVYFVKREFGFYTFYIPFQKNNRL
jgi:O-antigen/teichoic acid export membrane protein|tara:strand:+ start:51 stop:1442 length:1392 start_codon:yes stop_codon:yes gene_type:complete